MPTPKAVARTPRWYFVPVRVALVTVIVTLLSFAVGLFLGILGIIVGSWLRGGAPDMAMAYRHIAAPVAVGGGVIALLSAMVIEARHYRQAKALAGLSRQASRLSATLREGTGARPARDWSQLPDKEPP